MSVLLEIREVSRHFGGLTAVNRVSFNVDEGEIFGVIGPNGAGKTTLFNAITGLMAPSSGRIIYKGRDITRLRPHRIAARGIARTFQNIRLFPGLSALENVAIGQHLHARTGIFRGVLGLHPSPNEERLVRARSRELLELVGLHDRADRLAGSFAYGDRRRLEIARALALKPKVLLLDEPAAGMNDREKVQLSEFIRLIRQEFELTVLLIEHNVPLVMGLCDRLAVLHFGQLIAIGIPETVKRDPAVIEAYLG